MIRRIVKPIAALAVSLGILLGIVVLVAAVPSDYRHPALRLLTEIERAVSSMSSDSPPGELAAATPEVFVHRGRFEPDQLANSAAAIEAGAGRFANIEIDVAFSRDLIPYVSHGDDLAELTGQALGIVDDYDSESLDRLELRDGSRLMRLETFVGQFGGRYSDRKSVV